MGASYRTNMVGIFDHFARTGASPQLQIVHGDVSGESIDAPLLLGIERLQSKYHKKASASSAMSVSVTSPDFKKLMKRFGKTRSTNKGMAAAPIMILLKNTAKRIASKHEVNRGFNITGYVYYAKFVEFGFTKSNIVTRKVDGKQVDVKTGLPAFVEGKRLFVHNKNAISSIIVNSLKSMPGNKYDRDDIYKAMETAGVQIAQLLVSKSPVGPWDKRAERKFKDGWSATVKDMATNKESVVFGQDAVNG